MLFNSYTFLLAFLPAALLGFFVAARVSKALAGGWLAFASLVFYGWWNPIYVLLLVASIVFNYLMGGTISRARAAGEAARAKSIVAFAIATDLLLLCYYKYANFFVDNLATLTGTQAELGRIVLPLGISFYTFTQIAFLVDVYRGRAVEFNAVHYALFVTYFPHLIAGPILHHSEMMPQFRRRAIYRIQAENIAVGLTIFAIGLFKKTVLADGVAPFVGPVFNGASPTFFDAWGGALAYTCQLYFDFSGYSDMAIGLSRLFGIQLPINFDSPYKATSIIDFWRRWHITLSRFLRDYVYIGLGGNRHGATRRYLNLLLTMLLGGLWHGAGWTFVAWGGLHGAYLMVNHGWRALSRQSRRLGIGGSRLSRIVTFIAVVFGWVLFRSPTFHDAAAILAGMVGMNGISLPNAIAVRFPEMAAVLSAIGVEFAFGGGSQFIKMYGWLAVLMPILFLAPNTQQIMAKFRPGLGSETIEPAACALWHPNVRWAAASALVAALGFLSLHRASEFLYYQF